MFPAISMPGGAAFFKREKRYTKEQAGDKSHFVLSYENFFQEVSNCSKELLQGDVPQKILLMSAVQLESVLKVGGKRTLLKQALRSD